MHIHTCTYACIYVFVYIYNLVQFSPRHIVGDACMCVFSLTQFFSPPLLMMYVCLYLAWPIFLIATAGEAQQSVSGFMTGFIQLAADAVRKGHASNSDHKTSSETKMRRENTMSNNTNENVDTKSKNTMSDDRSENTKTKSENKTSSSPVQEEQPSPTSLLSIFEKACSAYWESHRGIANYNRALVRQVSRNVRRQSEINHSYSQSTGVHDTNIGLWFTQADGVSPTASRL